MRLVLLAFVDESNKKPYYCYAAVIASAEATQALTGDLNVIMQDLALEYGFPTSTEFHAHPIFQGKEVWKSVPNRVRVNVFSQVVDALVKNQVKVVMRGCDADRLTAVQDKRGYPVRHSAEQVAFQHFLQRVQSHAKARDTHALVIADNRTDRERHRDHFDEYQSLGTPGGYMSTRLERILDTIHFAPSNRSRMLQAADMVAFLFRRQATVIESDPRAAAAMASLMRKFRDGNLIAAQGDWP